MLKLHTNEGNPATLKVLIAANIAKVKPEIVTVQLNDESIPQPKHLPFLKIGEVNLFSSNASVLYFLKNESGNINEWLEWESTLLAPSLAQTFGCSLKNEIVNNVLVSCLQHFDKCLDNKTYLTNEHLTACDVAIWSSLYAAYKDEKLFKSHIFQFVNIVEWMKKLEERPEIKDALSVYTIFPGAYQILLNSNKLFIPFKSKENTSPAHQQTPIEVISEDELAFIEIAFQRTNIIKIKEQPKVVLPIPGERNILITSALPYVNNVPHLGNIIGCVLSADVFARFSRICNFNTLYIGGTDEYGTATETKAMEEGVTCKELCDKYYEIHKQIYEWFNISFDRFGRTSTPQQTELCHKMFLRLKDNALVFTQSVDQLHCQQCDRYLADRFVEGGCPHPGCSYEDARGDQCDGCGKLVNAVELKNPRCKICHNTPTLKTSEQFFLDLPQLQSSLMNWMNKKASGWSYNAQIVGKTWLREGLKPRCITRDLKWGVPVPLDGYRNKVFYVWFDAPIGYMSITKCYTKTWEKWWKPERATDVTLYQFMAKDNIPFHSVMFPAALLGAFDDYVTVSHIMATEYLNYEDGKFSKSRGVGVFGNDARDSGIPSDVWRFYLLFIRPETQDSTFSWIDLATKNNSELLNNLGNFINRALVFAKNNFNKTIPEMHPIKDDYIFLAQCTREMKNYINCLEKSKLKDGIRHILAISKHGNQYMQSNQPWVLLKGNTDEKLRACTVIGISCNIACLLAILLFPYMPETSKKLKQQLNAPDFALVPENPQINMYLPSGHKINDPSPLFIKLESDRIEELKLKFAGQQVNEKNTLINMKFIVDKIDQQPNKLNKMKQSGVDQKVLKPEVEVLSKLNNQLEAANICEKYKNTINGLQETVVVSEGVVQLEEEIAKQGALVRKLKEDNDKSVWQPEVKKLLELKQKLSILTGNVTTKNSKGKKTKT